VKSHLIPGLHKPDSLYQ